MGRAKVGAAIAELTTLSKVDCQSYFTRHLSQLAGAEPKATAE